MLPRSCCRKTSIAKVKWSSLLLSQWTVKGPPGSSSSTALREEMEGSRGMSVIKTTSDKEVKTFRKKKKRQRITYITLDEGHAGQKDICWSKFTFMNMCTVWSMLKYNSSIQIPFYRTSQPQGWKKIYKILPHDSGQIELPHKTQRKQRLIFTVSSSHGAEQLSGMLNKQPQAIYEVYNIFFPKKYRVEALWPPADFIQAELTIYAVSRV